MFSEPAEQAARSGASLVRRGGVALVPEDRPADERITVVVPTFREALNIPHLIERLARQREHLVDLQLLLVDDDSRDGSEELVAALALDWVRLVTRTEDRGLSQAVLEGLRLAKGDVLVVMDADLSHPPEALPVMLGRLRAGADFVVGSRFVSGGTTDDDWGALRWLNSRVATLLALPLTNAKDPMSGFFMLRRSTFERARDLNPIGYKIGLELLVKCECRRVEEVPIHFSDRVLGQSKLSLREQLRYLQHIRRLYTYRFELWSELILFLVVGASGLIVNLAILTVLLLFGVRPELASVPAILLSMLWNFTLNRRLSFGHLGSGPLLVQLARFVSACSIGALINYGVTLLLLPLGPPPQVAATCGVLVATGFNFVASRLYVFRLQHSRRKPDGEP